MFDWRATPQRRGRADHVATAPPLLPSSVLVEASVQNQPIVRRKVWASHLSLNRVRGVSHFGRRGGNSGNSPYLQKSLFLELYFRERSDHPPHPLVCSSRRTSNMQRSSQPA